MEMKKFNHMLEMDILRNSSQNILGVLRGAFLGFGCPKRHPDALLAKTMNHRSICNTHQILPALKLTHLLFFSESQ